jgi:hypothetical protein
MPIVQQDQNGALTIVLPNDAAQAQLDLKAQFDPVLSHLKAKHEDERYQPLLVRLSVIAQMAFDGIGGAPPNPQAALVQLGELKAEMARVDAQPGRFKLTLPPAEDVVGGREIVFGRLRGTTEVPAEQLELKGAIEETLTILQVIFPEQTRPSVVEQLFGNPSAPQAKRFDAYRFKLFSLARVGLERDADPKTAMQALNSLRAEILAQEGPRVKNGYMKRLGAWATASSLISAILYLVIRNNADFSVLGTAFRNVLVLWTGTMIGTWLSFGIRRNILTLRDLSNLEADMVEPAIRLIFTGLIAVTIAFIFMQGMVNVTVGQLNSANLFGHGSTAFLIGILLGVSEQALPGALTRRAAQFVSEVGGKP